MLPGLPSAPAEKVGAQTPCGRAWPDRFAWEIALLKERGRVIRAGIQPANPGYFVVNYLWPHRGRLLELGIIFPPGFPLSRPEIRILQQADRPRSHCNPDDGTLCYLGHDRYAWEPEQSVAAYIDQRLPMILDGTDAGEPVAEPAEEWWAGKSVPGSIFVIESEWTIGNATGGLLRGRMDVGPGRPPVVRCFVEHVLDEAGVKLAASTGGMPSEFAQAAQIMDLPWRLFEDELFPRDYRRVLDTVIATAPRKTPVKLRDGLYARIGIAVCPTEIAHGQKGLSWIFLVQTGDLRSFEPGREDRLSDSVARTMRAGPSDRLSRAPAADVIRNTRAVIAGVGAVGAPIALDLARNGAPSIAMSDSDIVNPGNGVRWPLGESAWGYRKVDVLARFIADNYAGVSTTVTGQRIGDLHFDAPVSESAGFVAALEEADILIDGTASFEAERLLYAQALRLGIPLVSAYGTPSLEGGVVACFVPGSGCPLCLLHHRVSGLVAPPPGEQADAHAVRLPGCAEATFAGSSHDLTELSVAAMRVIVRARSAPLSGSFIETLAFAGGERRPVWSFDQLPRHPACDCV